jgi:hypothetical protein
MDDVGFQRSLEVSSPTSTQERLPISGTMLPNNKEDCRRTVDIGFTPLAPLYRPLERRSALRIVVLQRGSGDSPITCNLVTIDGGANSLPYEALSYEWGQPSPDDPLISVDGHSTRIRKNLFDALRHIRLEERDRWLWIDSLSINQSDLEERGHQVNMMGRIYNYADNVVVWLGMAGDESDVAMKLLQEPISIIKSPMSPRRSLAMDDPYEYDESQCASILALCTRSYWRRVWIQQEIYLAQRFNVHCGSLCIPHRQFCSSLKILRGRRDIAQSPAFPLSQFYARRDDKLLHRWLRMGIKSDLQTSEPRDFIYAMLGISADCENGEIVPDYAKPLTQVYAETVIFCEMRGEYKVDEKFERGLAEKLGLAWDEHLKGFLEGAKLEMERYISTHSRRKYSSRRIKFSRTARDYTLSQS